MSRERFESDVIGELMISKYSTVSSNDLDTLPSNHSSNALLQATEWTMMIATWVNKGVFR